MMTKPASGNTKAALKQDDLRKANFSCQLGPVKKMSSSDNNFIHIPLGKDQPKDGPKIVYECRIARQAPCKLTHLTRSEAGRCHSMYNLRVPGNKKNKQPSLEEPKMHQTHRSKPKQDVPLPMTNLSYEKATQTVVASAKRERKRKSAVVSKTCGSHIAPTCFGLQCGGVFPLLVELSITKMTPPATSLKAALCFCDCCFEAQNWPENGRRYDTKSYLVQAQNKVLSERIMQVFGAKKQGAYFKGTKERFCNKLENLISTNASSFSLINPKVVIFGSTKCNLSLDDGDLDLCITTRRPPLNHDRRSILQLIGRAVRKLNFIQKSQPKVITINGRDVLIMTGIYSRCYIKVDIQIMVIEYNMNLEEPIRLTNLFTSLTEVDNRFRILAIIVKLWAKEQYLSLKSINIVLMLIQYLQIGCQPPVLPIVSSEYVKDVFNSTSSKQYFSSNKQSLGDLLIGFFRFYSEQFDFEKQFVSITRRRLRCRIIKKDNCGKSVLYVEEPFTQKNTIIDRRNPITPSKLQQVFRDSYSLMIDEKLEFLD